MTGKYEVQRYGSYFRGWCQAFGEHDRITNEETGTFWLLNGCQAGVLLKPNLAIQLNRQVLRKNQTPVIEFCSTGARIGEFFYPLAGEADEQGVDAIKKILNSGNENSLFVTSHFAYGTGTRILTLSNKKPLSIIYKQIGHMFVELA